MIKPVRTVELCAPDPEWRNRFLDAAIELRDILGDNLCQIHHIGSTSIPAIYAKPIVDILLEVTTLDGLDQLSPQMTTSGFEVMGEFGIEGRRYFRKTDSHGQRLLHIHSFERHNPEGFRHLAFRDYLQAHPAIAREYSDLKRSLAKKFPKDIDQYMDGKDPFIKRIEQDAISWRQSEPPSLRK